MTNHPEKLEMLQIQRSNNVFPFLPFLYKRAAQNVKPRRANVCNRNGVHKLGKI